MVKYHRLFNNEDIIKLFNNLYAFILREFYFSGKVKFCNVWKHMYTITNIFNSGVTQEIKMTD